MTEVMTGKGIQTADGGRAIGQATCRIVRELAEMAPLRDEWDALVAKTGGDIYFTYDWCCTWWRHYGRGRQLHVLELRLDGQLVGLLPLVIERLWLGLVPIRLARLLGSDSTTIVLNPPVMAEHAETIYRAALTFALQEQHCDAIWFGPLSGEMPHRQRIRRACDDSTSMVRIVLDHDIGVHTTFRLPASYDEYLAGLDKSQRGNVRRDRRNLEKQCRVTCESIQQPHRLEEPMREFLALHEAQWKTQGMLGHFNDWPAATAFNFDLVSTLAPHGRVQVLRLAGDDGTISYEYCFVFAGTLYWRLPARRTGEPWDKLGLGRVSLAYLIEQAIGAGVERIEAGAGHYDYKVRMGAVEYPLVSMLIAANRRSALLKTLLLCGFSRLLHLLYYRIWFGRLAPRLPLRRRPLWKIWIRSRL